MSKHRLRIIILLIVQIFVALVILKTKSTSAFWVNVHSNITTEALEHIEKSVDNHTYRFSSKAIFEIQDFNKDVDYSHDYRDFQHCDNEMFEACTAELIRLKGLIIREITKPEPDGREARTYLGQALHTLQDFYAHSNWVELGNTHIDLRLGRDFISGLPRSARTCIGNQTLLTEFGLSALTSGWHPTREC